MKCACCSGATRCRVHARGSENRTKEATAWPPERLLVAVLIASDICCVVPHSTVFLTALGRF